MAQYYYLVSGLPELLPDTLPKQLDHLQLKGEVLEHIHPSDLKTLQRLYLPYDNAVLLTLARQYLACQDPKDFFVYKEDGEELRLGNYAENTLREAFKEPEGLPGYMLDFVNEVLQWDRFDASVNALEHALLNKFYEEMGRSSNAFLRHYYAFDAEIRNVLYASTLRKLQREDVRAMFIGEGELVQYLAKNTSPDFGIKGVLDYAEDLFRILEISDWVERERALDRMRWEFAQNLVRFEDFSLNVVLAFLLKVQWTERWLNWDSLKGRKMLEDLSEQVSGSYDLELLTQ